MRIIFYTLCLLLSAAPSIAGWELYDNFDGTTGGVPKSELWDFTEGNVTVEDGQMKIVFKSTDDPAVFPEATNSVTDNIYGIKFDFKVTSWSEVVAEDLQPHFRVVRAIGTYPDALYPNASILVSSRADDENADMHYFKTEYSALSGDWNSEIMITANQKTYRGDSYLNKWRTMSVIVTGDGLSAFLDSQPSKIYFGAAIPLNFRPFQLEIRPSNLGDELTVYIDNVYVYRGEPSDFADICPNPTKTVVIPLM